MSESQKLRDIFVTIKDTLTRDEPEYDSSVSNVVVEYEDDCVVLSYTVTNYPNNRAAVMERRPPQYRRSVQYDSVQELYEDVDEEIREKLDDTIQLQLDQFEGD